MKINWKWFYRNNKHLYLVIAYWKRPKVGEIHEHQPLTLGIYKNIEKAKQQVEEIKSMRMYAYVTYVSIITDL